MPNRILRTEILTSERVDKLDFAAEVFYRRLMSVVDDYGLYDARLPVLKSALYPLKGSTIREADIPRWLTACEEAGLIALYSVDGKPYLLLHKLGEPRAKKSKYPPPPANACTHAQTSARTCEQAQASVPYSDSLSDSPTSSGGIEPPPTYSLALPGTPELRKACLEAFDRWSKVKRGFGLKETENEHEKVFTLIAECTGEAPILQGGQLVPRQNLIPLAANNCRDDNSTPFKGMKYACTCAKNLLDEWSRNGMPGSNNGKRPSRPSPVIRLGTMKART